MNEYNYTQLLPWWHYTAQLIGLAFGAYLWYCILKDNARNDKK